MTKTTTEAPEKYAITAYALDSEILIWTPEHGWSRSVRSWEFEDSEGVTPEHWERALSELPAHTRTFEVKLEKKTGLRVTELRVSPWGSRPEK